VGVKDRKELTRGVRKKKPKSSLRKGDVDLLCLYILREEAEDRRQHFLVCYGRSLEVGASAKGSFSLAGKKREGRSK